MGRHFGRNSGCARGGFRLFCFAMNRRVLERCHHTNARNNDNKWTTTTNQLLAYGFADVCGGKSAETAEKDEKIKPNVKRTSFELIPS